MHAREPENELPLLKRQRGNRIVVFAARVRERVAVIASRERESRLPLQSVRKESRERESELPMLPTTVAVVLPPLLLLEWLLQRLRQHYLGVIAVATEFQGGTDVAEIKSIPLFDRRDQL